MSGKKWARTTYNYFHHESKNPYFKMFPQTHKQKVLALYKDCLKSTRWADREFDDDQLIGRWKKAEIRQRFEENRNIKDYRVAKKLLEDGRKEYMDNRAPDGVNFSWSPGGVQYQRTVETGFADFLLDAWDPMEKAVYPYYFARREQRKQEYIKLYESEYGNCEEALGLDDKRDYVKIMEEYIEDVRAREKEYDQTRMEEEKNKNREPFPNFLTRPSLIRDK